jgi:hypothetical protein
MVIWWPRAELHCVSRPAWRLAPKFPPGKAPWVQRLYAPFKNHFHISAHQRRENAPTQILDLLVRDPGTFCIMDRDYIDFQRLDRLHEAGIS